ELLTGHRPFNGKNARLLAQQHMNEAPDLRALPEAERPVVARALEKDPARRFPSCLAFVRSLYAARPAVPVVPVGAGKRRRPMVDPLEALVLGAPSALGALTAEDAAPLSGINESGEAVSNLGVTVAAPATGALRPTVFLGVGGFGRRALMELRCRF